MIVLDERKVRGLVTMAEAIAAVRGAFVALADGRVIMPDPVEIDFRHTHADFHVKGAFVEGFPYFTFKLIGGFYENAKVGLPVTSGLVVLFDSQTGVVRAVILDNGYLTNLRTGAAGAIAADLLANSDVKQVAIIGSGTQARFQLEALVHVRHPSRVVIWSRDQAHAEVLAKEVRRRHELEARVVDNPEAACRGSRIIVSATTSRRPILESGWIEPGTHLTAVGSDVPAKQELDVSILAMADVVAADRLSQCLQSGEIHHAVGAGVLDPARAIEIGDLAAGRVTGRRSADDVTVADLTGLGIQDAAVGSVVGRRLGELHPR